MSEPPFKEKTLHEAQATYGNLTWNIAKLFPAQGTWSESEYMSLRPSRIIEYDRGYLEIHDVPSTSHQLIVAFVFQALYAFISARDLGTVLFAPLRVKLWEEKYREPDIVFISKAHLARRGEEFWLGADLVIEVVSEGSDNRERDLVKKRADYAQGGIPEYWIIDPNQQTITVLKLDGDHYNVHGEFKPGSTATSALLNGFGVEVESVFAAARQ